MDSDKAAELERWLELLADSYNVLPMDAASFREWGRVTHRKSDMLLEDAMIAATARVHSLTVVTRNVADFQSLGVAILDPFTTGAGSR
jgi:toxin FitB